MSKMLASSFGPKNCSLRSNAPLSDEQIMAVAPSIFGQDKHEDRSARYTYIPTINVLQALRKEGFEPFMVCQTATRDASRREFAKHMVRLRRGDQTSAGEANEIILLNSHDGTSAYQMLAGLFRFVCENGLVAGDISSDMRVPHMGNVVGRVIEGAYEVLDEFGRVIRSRNMMEARPLTRLEAYEFAEKALELRFPVGENLPISPRQVLTPRRAPDGERNLWTTFNVVQENLIRGGLLGFSANGRRAFTRGVKAIDASVKLNRGLWNLAEEML